MTMNVKGLLLALALALAPTAATAFTGTGTLTGTWKFTVPGCGSDRGALVTSLTVAADGTWTAQSSDGPSFSGTYVAVGTKKLRLTLDATTTAALAPAIVADAERLCSAGVTLTGSHPRALTLSLKHKGTIAKLTIGYTFSGRSKGHSGSASYHVAGHGPWTAG